MELATPPPAARAPVAWYSWWLMPLGLGGGTVAATFMSSERLTAAVAGVAATGASAVCVRLLLRTRARLRRTEETHRAAQAEHSRQWQRHMAGLESKTTAERAALEARLADSAAAYEAQLAERARAYDEALAERTKSYDERIAAQTASYEDLLAERIGSGEDRVAEQAETYEARLAEQTRTYEDRLADQAAEWQEQLAHGLAAVRRLADEQLPEAVRRLRAGDAIDDILPALSQFAQVNADLQAELRKVLRTSLMGVEAEFDRSTSAEQAVISIGNRIHVLTSKLRGRLHEMQGEHGRLPAVARGLMELDQAIGPADCLAASIGVLGGSDRPGRQWQEPQRLLSVVRGGIGRIKDFHRIQLHHLPELGVDGGLVDHLTLIFAHLLDNAARYSPPTEPVVVSGKEVPNGVGIEIQDSGKGLNEEKKREAEHALAGTGSGAGIGGISEDANIGLRVVGILARRYGIRVTFADSPWLGTSVVVVVPHKYFGPLPSAAASTAAAQAAAEPAAPEAVPPALAPVVTLVREESAEPSAGTTTPGGLPRRRSRRSEPARPASESRAERPVMAAVPPDASFAGLAAFATAGRDPGTASGPERPADRDTTTGGPATEHRTEESD
ncbi:ATP-binding protein [Streptomyces ziwulingensis]|uniref:histidine kinase n=1 Tax=Streptomyces ziwulingensis TaxID=1045501 RepID=A0ABP9B1P4_9ACTN